MLFYKYQKAGDLEFGILRRGEIFFASVGELNDASECRPRFILKGSEELWQRLTRFVLEHVCFGSEYFQNHKNDKIRQILELCEPMGRHLKKIAGNRDFGIENLNSAFIQALKNCGPEKIEPDLLHAIQHNASVYIKEELPRALLDEKYIASFALNAINPAMWGHYADAEKGFVRVFETNDGMVSVLSDLSILHGTRPSKTNKGFTEVGIYKDASLELKAVKYGKQLPKVNAFHRLIQKFSYTEEEDRYDVPLNLGGEAEEKKEHLIGMIKHSDWRYEKEVRAFFPVFESLLPDVRILRISLKNIKGLIFGPKMCLKDKARAVLCCHLMKQARSSEINQECDFLFFEAQQTLDKVGFAIQPVGILDGRYYGRHLPLKPVRELDKAIVARLHTIADEIGS